MLFHNIVSAYNAKQVCQRCAQSVCASEIWGFESKKLGRFLAATSYSAPRARLFSSKK